MRRAAQRPPRNPLTGLPGNVLLQGELERLIAQARAKPGERPGVAGERTITAIAEGQVVIVVDAEDLPEIEADHRAVKQILLNLLSNAVKFTSEGQITVEVGSGIYFYQLVADDFSEQKRMVLLK